jgi:hypothetical protein
MPHTLRMPSPEELPYGTVRDFVTLLFWLYTSARRPALEAVSAHIRENNYPGTASRETIRRMLNGTTVPPRWETTETVFHALASLAKHEPHEHVSMFGWRLPLTELAERLWNRALDEPWRTGDSDGWGESESPAWAPPKPVSSRKSDPWGSEDDPPF